MLARIRFCMKEAWEMSRDWIWMIGSVIVISVCLLIFPFILAHRIVRIMFGIDPVEVCDES